LGIRDETFDIQLPSLQDVRADVADIETLSIAPELSIPAIVGFSIHRFKLDPIISEIKLLFYHLPSQISAYSWPADHQETQQAIRQKLETWRADIKSMSGELSQVPHEEEHELDMRRYELKVQSQFFSAMILLYQPSQMIPNPREEALLICYQCAASRINIYNSLYSADGLFQSWRSVQGVFSSGATMIYCLWTSASVQKSIPLSSAITDLRTCTNLLSIGGEWWPSVKRGKETFGRAMDALLQKLDQSRTSTRMQRNTRTRNNQSASNMEHQIEDPGLHAGPMAPGRSNELGDAGGLGEINAELCPTYNVPSHVDPAIDYSTEDWTNLGNFGDQSLQFSSHNFDGTMFGMHLDNPDNTVEAFITEYLQNDTAWNPF
jgi:hypothetical protein